MSNQASISVRSHSAAERDLVFRLLTDSTTWADWTPFSSVNLIEPAQDGGEGPGSVKETRYKGSKGVERVISVTPDLQMSYAYVKGSMSPYMRDYVAVVDLTDGGSMSGTDIHWHSSFHPRLLGFGWIVRRILEPFLQRCADGLAAEAAKRAQTE